MPWRPNYTYDGFPVVGRLTLSSLTESEPKPRPTLDQVIEATKPEPAKVPERPKPWYPALVDAIGHAGMLAKDIQAWILTGKHVTLQGEAMLATCKFITYAVNKSLIEIADNGRVFSYATRRARKLDDLIYSLWTTVGAHWSWHFFSINQRLKDAGFEPATEVEMRTAWERLKITHNIKTGCG